MAENALETAHRLYDKLQSDFSGPNALHEIGNPLAIRYNLNAALNAAKASPLSLGIPGARDEESARAAIDAAFEKAARAILQAEHPRGGPAYPLSDTFQLSLAVSKKLPAAER